MMKIQLLILLVATVEVTFGQVCGNYTTCVGCTGQTGCNFCQAYGATSIAGCSSNPDATSAHCTGTGDQADRFILSGNPTDCFGGCGTGSESCNQCVGLAGCGWCFTMPSGCHPSASGCSAFVTGTCTRPCLARDNCQMCLDGSMSCDWCSAGSDSPSHGTCANHGTCGTAASAATLTDPTTCPAPPATNLAVTVAVKLPLLAALLSLFYFFF